MSLGLKIWLISALSKIGFLSEFVLCVCVLIGAVSLLAKIIFQMDDGLEIDFSFLGNKKIVIGMILLLISYSLIPSKENLYAIMLTNDVTEQELYNMTKEEMKAGIDYMVREIKKIK